MGGVESTEGGIQGVYGLQVGSLLPRSPASKAGLLPFFDFIVKVDTYELSEDSVTFFRDYLKKHVDSPVKLTVYNSKLLCLRELTLIPSDGWGGSGLLGCSLEWSNTIMSWHVTGVKADSPLSSVLSQKKDFIIGMESVPGDPKHPVNTLFCDKDDFHSRLTEKMQLRLERQCPDKLLLLVYDDSDNTIREVYADLGRSPSLGIDVGNGYLHNIPPGKELPVMRSFIEFREGQAAEGFMTATHSNAGQQHVLPTAEQEVDKEEQRRLSLLFQAQQDHEKRVAEEKKKEEEHRRLNEEKLKAEAEAAEKQKAAQMAQEEALRIQEQERLRKEEEDRIKQQAEAELRRREHQLRLEEEQKRMAQAKADQEKEAQQLARQQEEILSMQREHEAQMEALRQQQETLKKQREQQEEMRKQIQQMQQQQIEEEKKLRAEREALEAGQQATADSAARFNQGAVPRSDCRPSPVSVPSTGSLDQFPQVQPVKQYAPQLEVAGQPAFPHSPMQFTRPHGETRQPVASLPHTGYGQQRSTAAANMQVGHEPQASSLPSSRLPVENTVEKAPEQPSQGVAQGQGHEQPRAFQPVASHVPAESTQVGHEDERKVQSIPSSSSLGHAQPPSVTMQQAGHEQPHTEQLPSASSILAPRPATSALPAVSNSHPSQAPKPDLFDILTAGHTGGASADGDSRSLRRDSDFAVPNDNMNYPFYAA